MIKSYFSNIGRSELKYFIAFDIIPHLKEFIKPYMELDPYSAERDNNNYTVRSIYFDTSKFDFYYDKMDGLKVRKKLRVRTYNKFNHINPAFLEIKRRYVNRVLKERVKVPLSQVEQICTNLENPKFDDNNFSDGKQVIDKYYYNLRKLDLKPTALITYEREAYIGLMDSHTRLTIDKNLRSLIYPRISDIFMEDDLKMVIDLKYILELKYDGYMPKWMGRLVHELSVRAEPIPKYCLGLEAWFEKTIKSGRVIPAN